LGSYVTTQDIVRAKDLFEAAKKLEDEGDTEGARRMREEARKAVGDAGVDGFSTLLGSWLGYKGVKKLELGTPAHRIERAEGLFKRKLTDVQRAGLEQAHLEGEGTLGNYTKPEIRNKLRILKKAGFTQAERKLLLKEGICGRVSAAEIDELSDENYDGHVNEAPSSRKAVQGKPGSKGRMKSYEQHMAENQEFRDVKRKLNLTDDQARQLHDKIKGEDMDYAALLEFGMTLFPATRPK
jgi:hypothetical protein